MSFHTVWAEVTSRTTVKTGICPDTGVTHEPLVASVCTQPTETHTKYVKNRKIFKETFLK